MAQQLTYKDEFQKVLKTYAPDRAVQEILKDARIALFDGPSASGRNTIMQRLVETGKYQQIVSDTTRKPRFNNGVPEINGKEYWFKSERDFLDGLQSGQYLEAAIIHDQQVSGVSISELKRISKEGKIAINDIQPDGVEAFRKYKPDTICIFVIPPNFQTWIKRLRIRGEMSEEEQRRRFLSAVDEIEHALAVDYYGLLINNNLEQAVADADALCSGIKSDFSEARTAAKQLLEAIKSHL